MDQALVGAVVGATIQVLLQTMLSASFDEIKRVFGFKKDLTKLKESLLMIQAFLADAEEKRINSRAVKLWLARLEDVAFEADAVIDKFNYELLRQEVKVTSFFSFAPSNLLFRKNMASKIRNVNQKLEMINNEASNFGLQMEVVNATHTSTVGLVMPPELQTDSFAVRPNFVGRDKEVLKIVEMLVTAPQEKTLFVLPIFGMGGIGKTTLTQQVFHHENIRAQFGERMWVCVSVHFSIMNLFKMILETLTQENVKAILTKEVVLEKIQKRLEGKRYLLVLDDVWNENFDQWDDFMSSLLGISSGGKGSCVVVTTRRENVALGVETLPSYRLRGLSEDECWRIIKSKALSRVDAQTEFEEIGRRIAQRCRGMPLAAKVIGGLLHGKKSKDEWLSILTKHLTDFGQDGNPVMKILRLSYDHLPSSALKKCFAYCSIFPQDFRIDRVKLIELWMAEGFLHAEQGIDMESVGNRFVDYLAQNSLLQGMWFEVSENITLFTMHDLVNDLACSVSGSRNTSLSDVRSSGMQKVRYLQLNSSTDGSKSSDDITQEQAMYLRTVFLGDSVYRLHIPTFKCLHSLSVAKSDIIELPSSIGKLIHLRLLDISSTKIQYLPDSVGRLYNLQTLRTINEYGYVNIHLKRLPNTTVDLIRLRHLLISCTLPPGIGKLISLRALPYFKAGQEKGCRIGELRNLKNLKGKLRIENLEKVADKEEAKHADLFGKQMSSLVLKWNDSRREGETDNENVLDGLQPPPELKVLQIIGYNGERFPLWTMRMKVYNETEGCLIRLDNLVEICVEKCNQCKEVPMLGQLPHLKSLELKGFPNVHCIGLSFYGIETGGTSSMPSNLDFQGQLASFPALEKLYLEEMVHLTDWVEVEGSIAVFPCIKYLSINSCPQLKIIPGHFSGIEHIYILPPNRGSGSDVPTMNLRGTDIPELLFSKMKDISRVTIENIPTLIRVPCWPGGGTSLTVLRLYECPSLTELPENLNFPCLVELKIHSCPKIMSIPYPTSESSLRILSIKDCQGITDLPSELVESCTFSLEQLSLCDLENFANLDMVIPYLLRMSHLERLDLVNLPKLMNFPAEISCLRSLKALSIGRFSESLNLVSFDNFLHHILQELTLRELFIHGQEDWDSLPDQIQHLTAVQTLEICHFGIETLPEWLGNLSALEVLCIRNCQSLRLLPSKVAMQRITPLRSLYIERCPLLKGRCSRPQSTDRGDDSEWHKISHIRNVNTHRA